MQKRVFQKAAKRMRGRSDRSLADTLQIWHHISLRKKFLRFFIRFAIFIQLAADHQGATKGIVKKIDDHFPF